MDSEPVDNDDISKPSLKSKNDPVMMRAICRYGPGCTHILDPTHREKFWHLVRPQYTGMVYNLKMYNIIFCKLVFD